MAIELTTSWAQGERDGWLCRLYGEDNDDGTSELPPQSIQASLVKIIDGLLTNTTSPRDAAVKTIPLLSPENDTPFMNLIGLCLHAAESFADENILQALVDYFVTLVGLSSAANERLETTQPNMREEEQQVEPIGITGSKNDGGLLKEVPNFSIGLTESLQGPEAYLYSVTSPASPEEAKQTWSNINTYVALLAKSPDAQNLPYLAGQVMRGPRTLAMALEFPLDSLLGKNIDVHVPAAAQWLRIAGEQVEEMCAEGKVRARAGDLWLAKGGSDVCDTARLGFWRERLVELGF